MVGLLMDVAMVRKLARQQRAVPHPTRYHAGRHGFGFQECVAALENCYAVKPDERQPRGRAWFALASHTHARTIRIDFDAHEDEDGDLLLIVTAYHL